MYLTLITGALHEDGFADFVDGFGGATKERTLEIMKDSRLGTFGAIGLIFLFGVKFIILTETDPQIIPISILVALVVGRFGAIPLLKMLPYVRKKGVMKPLEKSAPSIEESLSWIAIAASFVFSFTVSYFFIGITAMYVFIAVALLIIALGAYFHYKIGGITGDCGGAAEQLGEVMTLAVILVLA